MPNHFHFLIKIKEEKEILAFGKFQTFQKLNNNNKLEKLISKQFSNFFSSYTQSFNKMYSRKGSLFSPNFKRKEITSDAYLTNIIFYIHHNPVHHGFVEDLREWPHSSIHAVLSNKETQIKRNELIDWYGSLNEFQEVHRQSIKGLEKLEMDLCNYSI